MVTPEADKATQRQPSQPCPNGLPLLPKSTQEGQPCLALSGLPTPTVQPTQVQESKSSSLVGPPSPAMPSHAMPTQERATQEEDKTPLHTWENVKVLKGKNLHDAKRYLGGRYGKRCTECGLESDDEQFFDIHHIDGNPQNNKRGNLFLADHPCNARLNGNVRAEKVKARLSSLVHPVESVSDVRQDAGVRTERGTGAVVVGVRAYPSEAQWESQEGVRHDRQRSLWNAWILDQLVLKDGSKVKGPFVGREVFGFSELAYMAPRALGVGSSKTYMTYINEDHFGPLEIIKTSGRKYVMLRKEWIQKHGGIIPKMEEDDD